MAKECSHSTMDGHNARTCQSHTVRLFGAKLTACCCCAADGFHGGAATRERKKAVQWTEYEHKMFLLGLKRLGKGDWCGISRNYVFTRTPTQVASHAQKYFLRHTSNRSRNRRSSVFDISFDQEKQESEERDTCLHDAAFYSVCSGFTYPVLQTPHVLFRPLAVRLGPPLLGEKLAD